MSYYRSSSHLAGLALHLPTFVQTGTASGIRDTRGRLGAQVIGGSLDADEAEHAASEKAPLSTARNK